MVDQGNSGHGCGNTRDDARPWSVCMDDLVLLIANDLGQLPCWSKIKLVGHRQFVERRFRRACMWKLARRNTGKPHFDAVVGQTRRQQILDPFKVSIGAFTTNAAFTVPDQTIGDNNPIIAGMEAPIKNNRL